jgi:hypothetical protein
MTDLVICPRTGKDGYPSGRAARHALKGIRARSHRNSAGVAGATNLGVYECRACGLWHLGRRQVKRAVAKERAARRNPVWAP